MWLTTVTCTVSGDGGGEAETVTMDTSTPRTVASAAPRAAWAVTDQVSATVSENATASVLAPPGERGGAGGGEGTGGGDEGNGGGCEGQVAVGMEQGVGATVRQAAETGAAGVVRRLAAMVVERLTTAWVAVGVEDV